MADYPPKRGAAYSFEFPVFDGNGDLVSGVTFSASQISKDGGAFAGVGTAPAEIGTSGVYTQALSAAEMTADRVALRYVIASQADVMVHLETATRQLLDLLHSAQVMEGTLTLIQLMRIFLSALAGKTTGGGLNFRDAADSKNRIVATVDSSNNRTSITLDGS